MTLATVGFGDLVPETTTAKLVHGRLRARRDRAAGRRSSRRWPRARSRCRRSCATARGGEDDAVSEGRVTWLGHATVLVELGGTRLLTDPVLRPRVAHLRRQVPTPAPPGPLDAVLISHLHRDHLDLPSLRALDAREIIVPRGAARALRGRAPACASSRRASARMIGDVEVARGPRRCTTAGACRSAPPRRRGRLRRRRAPAGLLRRRHRAVRGDGRAGAARRRAAARVGLGPVARARAHGPGGGRGDRARSCARPWPSRSTGARTCASAWRRRAGRLLRDPPRRFAARVAERAPDTRVELLAPGGSVSLD